MSKYTDRDLSEASGTKVSKRVRLQALMFTSAAFGTAALTLGAFLDPKLPIFQVSDCRGARTERRKEAR